MTATTIRTLSRHLALAAFAALLLAPQLATAALSLSQVPLFITISMPPNITVLLDDSGSMAWGHVPDALGETGSGTVLVAGGSVTATCTGTTHHGSCSTGTYNYGCSSGTLTGTPTSGTSSTPPNTLSCTGGYQSMSSIYVPDSHHYKSSAFNPIYYDPTITYLPGYSTTGTLLTTSFTAAYCNPYNTSAGTVNLSTSYEATVDFNPNTSSCSTLMNSTDSEDGDPSTDEVDTCDYFLSDGSCHTPYGILSGAYYYTYNTANSGCTTTNKGPSGASTDDRCYTLVTVSATSGPGGTDERQNFANWWSFYRTRNLTTNTSANRAFTAMSGNMRLAWRDLNTCSAFDTTTCAGWSSTVYDNRIGAFTGQHRIDFFTWLTRYPAHNGTPLRTGLDSIGAYYQTSGTDSPYAFTPHVTDSPEYVCRPNYAVIMTDGLWNDSSIPSTPSIGNTDNTAVTLPDNTSYPPTATGTSSHPYSDSSSSSLADIAFYYWSHNLRSDLGTSTALQYMPVTKSQTVTDNKGNTVTLIPYWNPQNDPASWPHMVTFTVGLGMTSTILSPAWGGSTYAGNASGYNNLVTNNIAWPSVSSNSTNNVYDLWHAALDSRGQFFSADTPQDVAAAFNAIVSRIQGRVGSSSAVAVNSTRLDSNTAIYQALFNSAGWTGDVLSFPLTSTGLGSQLWQASTQIPAAASRTIFTWDETANSNKGAGTSFLWSSLNSAEQTLLNENMNQVTDGNGSLRVNYLRGDQSDEQNNSGIFRTRTSLMGDIVNSNPVYVGNENFGFDTPNISEGSTYGAFLATKPSRTNMLYVGANDGMLHGINASTGAEVFTYVPRGVYPNLSALTDPLYTHQFYVNGSPLSIDAYVNSAWTTLVVGTTGAGAKEVFLLDVNKPTAMTTAKVLWDYDGTDGTVSGTSYSASGVGSTFNTLPDPDMGYTISEPSIVRMHDGNWYVLFANGYNSTNNQAVIYLYNINTQTLLKYSTGTGSAASPNGMASPTPVDFDGDRITDAIYAGDLLGNLWKMDVSGSSPANWHFVTYGNAKATPLFTAKDSSGNVQPITEEPAVALNANNQVMLFFGTGTYFQTTDNTVGTTPPVMSFYGLIDDKGSASTDVITRSTLLQQQILGTGTVSGNNFRITTANTMSSSNQGWYMDLLNPPTPGTAVGERVVSDPVVNNGTILFATIIPQGNACQFGGTSWLMLLDMNSGSQMKTSPIDTNGDGQINSKDLVTATITTSSGTVTGPYVVSGVQSNGGEISTPAIVSNGQTAEAITSPADANPQVYTLPGNPNSRRLSWQQLQ